MAYRRRSARVRRPRYSKRRGSTSRRRGVNRIGWRM